MADLDNLFSEAKQDQAPPDKKTLKKGFKKSADRLVELKAGRHVDDIPINDEYWVALKLHMMSHG